MLNKTNRTYDEDLKDPGKMLIPSRYVVLIALREDESDQCVPFALFDDLPLDLRHGSAIKTPISGSLGLRVTDLAHPVRSPIASTTACVSASTCFPFNLR